MSEGGSPRPTRRIRFAWLGTRLAKWIVGLLLAIPFLLLLNDVRIELVHPGQGLGPFPGEALVEYLGTWSIRMLYLTLLLSSVSRLFKIPLLVQHRRIFGLWAFTYVLMHFAAYVSALAGFDLNVIFGDFSKRPYIIVGLIALGLLIPLAVTSTNGWQRRLRLNWKHLHRLVYLIAILALVHLWMQEKATVMDTAIYGSILLLLFLERILTTIQKTRARST